MKQLSGVLILAFLLTFTACDPSDPLTTEEMITLIEEANAIDSTGVITDSTDIFIPGGGEPSDSTDVGTPSDSTDIVIPGGGGEPSDSTDVGIPSDSTDIVIPGGGGEPSDSTDVGTPSDSTGVVIPGGGDDCLCFTLYEPVCAEGITFNNACEAECAGFTSYTEGPCAGSSFPDDSTDVVIPGGGGDPSDSTGVVIPGGGGEPNDSTGVVTPGGGDDCFCFTLYEPVCAEGTTFSNACEAACAGFTSYTEGECP